MNAMEKYAVSGFVQQVLDERYKLLMEHARPHPFSHNTSVIETRAVGRLLMADFSLEVGKRIESLVESTTPDNPLDKFRFVDEKHP